MENSLLIALISISIIILYLSSNKILNFPIKLYDIIKKDLNKKDNNIKVDMKLINLDKHSIMDLKIDDIENEKEEILRQKKDLEKLLKIKDSIYGLKKDLLTKNAKLVKFVEDTRERVLDAALDAEEQKKMAEKAVIWILEVAKRQELLEKEASKIKKEMAEKSIRLAQQELDKLKNNKLMAKQKQEKLISLGKDATEQELSKLAAKDAARVAKSEATLATSYKNIAKKQAKAAEASANEAKKKSESLIAKKLLEEITNKTFKDTSKIRKLIEEEKLKKRKILDEAKIEKEELLQLKIELEKSNENLNNVKIKLNNSNIKIKDIDISNISPIIKGGNLNDEYKKAYQRQINAKFKWDNRKEILLLKIKEFRKKSIIYRKLLNQSKDDLEKSLNDKLQAEKELLKKEQNANNAERLNRKKELEMKNSKDALETQEKLKKIQDRVKDLDSKSKIMAEKEKLLIQQKQSVLEQKQLEVAEMKVKLDLVKKNKELELIENENKLKNQGIIPNVSLYRIPDSDNKPYKELYKKYPILKQYHILVLPNVKSAINVLNHMSTVEIDGHIGKVHWIEKGTGDNYCNEDKFKSLNFINELPENYECPASFKSKNNCVKCGDIELDSGIILLKDLLPPLNKDIINKTLSKLDKGIVDTVLKHTPLDLHLHNMIDLTKHNIDCGNGVINQFNLQRGIKNEFASDIDNKLPKGSSDWDQIGYKYTCGMFSDNNEQNIEEDITDVQSHGNGNTIYLDRQNVNCNKGLLSQFKLSKYNNGIQYNYGCSNINTKNCVNKNTNWNDEGGGNVIFIDRHDLKCDKESYLKQFKLTRNGKGKYRYNYTCCEIDYDTKTKTTIIPDKYVKDKFIYNSNYDDNSFIFNGLNNYLIINKDNAPVFDESPFTIEFNFKLNHLKHSYIISQGKIPEANKCCTFFGVSIRHRVNKKNLEQSFNNEGHLYITTGRKMWISKEQFKLNIEYHIAITLDTNKNIIVYSNGVPLKLAYHNDKNNYLNIETFNEKNKVENGFKSSGPIYIGKLHTESQDSHFFKGHINNFKIWNKTRTEQEIKDNINKRVYNDSLILFMYLNSNDKNIYIHEDVYTGESESESENKEKKIIDNNSIIQQHLFKNNYVKLKKNLLNNKIDTYPNYKITFQLKILGKVPQWGNLFHITKTGRNCCGQGDRNPAVWTFPNSTRLHLVTGGYDKKAKNYNLSINPIKELQLNKEYLIEITRINSNVKFIIKDITDKNNINIFIKEENNDIYPLQKKITEGQLTFGGLGNVASNSKIKNFKYNQIDIISNKKTKSKSGFITGEKSTIGTTNINSLVSDDFTNLIASSILVNDIPVGKLFYNNVSLFKMASTASAHSNSLLYDYNKQWYLPWQAVGGKRVSALFKFKIPVKLTNFNWATYTGGKIGPYNGWNLYYKNDNNVWITALNYNNKKVHVSRASAISNKPLGITISNSDFSTEWKFEILPTKSIYIYWIKMYGDYNISIKGGNYKKKIDLNKYIDLNKSNASDYPILIQ